jgi:glycosyltransferase involved in cell wall biosynthesis
MAWAIERGLADNAFLARLLDAGARAAARHTWDEVGRRTIAAYEDLAARPPRLMPRRRHRVAFVGPLPPTESGIAVYNERVLAAMQAPTRGPRVHRGRRNQRGATSEIAAPSIGRGTDETLDPNDYDLFVHTIGNSRYHARSFDLARRHPVCGCTTRLIGLHLEWALWQIRSGLRQTDVLTIYRDEIARLYDGRVDADSVLVEPLSHHAFVERGVYLAAGLVRAAKHLIVNSELARTMAQADLAPGELLPPTTVLHHAVPERSSSVRTQPRAERPLVAAFGVVHAIKRPVIVIEAVAALGFDVDLVFVGPCGGARQLVRAAARGLSDRVLVTGHVSQDSTPMVEEVDVAVQPVT